MDRASASSLVLAEPSQVVMTSPCTLFLPQQSNDVHVVWCFSIFWGISRGCRKHDKTKLDPRIAR